MIKRLIIIMSAFLMVTPLAVAKEIGGAKLPDSMTAGKDELVLNGAGLRKKYRFVKIYVGQPRLRPIRPCLPSWNQAVWTNWS